MFGRVRPLEHEEYGQKIMHPLQPAATTAASVPHSFLMHICLNGFVAGMLGLCPMLTRNMHIGNMQTYF